MQVFFPLLTNNLEQGKKKDARVENESCLEAHEKCHLLQIQIHLYTTMC